MDTITIICNVAAQFSVPGREDVFEVDRKEIGQILSAPAWIVDSNMFKWLLADGSLKAVTVQNKAQLDGH